MATSIPAGGYLYVSGAGTSSPGKGSNGSVRTQALLQRRQSEDAILSTGGVSIADYGNDHGETMM